MLFGGLASVREAVDEMVDTGSHDRTCELTLKPGGVSDRPWREFADAWDAAIEQAKGVFLLILDVDERLAEGRWPSAPSQAARPHARRSPVGPRPAL